MNFRILSFAFLALVLLQQHGIAQQRSFSRNGDPVKGKGLFERDWKSSLAERSADSDGLGPVFNAVSCVACHNQGDVGGGGPVSNNAQLLSLLPSRNKNGSFDLSEGSLDRMFSEGEKIHQDLATSNGIVLHRFSAVDEYQHWRDQLVWGNANVEFAEQRNQILNQKPIHRITKSIPSERSRGGKRKPATELTIQISQRNTPSLFGAGLIEQVTDKSIRAIEREQREFDKDAIAGKVARLPDDTFGKFGWRGQKSSLEEFTVQACAVELGLGTASQIENELPSSLETSEETLQPSGNDMTQNEMVDMVEFIRQLPPPYENLPTDPKQLEIVERGEAVFTRLNCATCHVKKVGDVDGVYSDFLMHDMGQELADVSGVITQSTRTKSPTQSIGGYFGPSTAITSNGEKTFAVGNDSFWQTPPLWGIADSAPYMHDGRARDYHEAILLHAGEAIESRNAYQRLPAKYQRYLNAYLETLGAVK